MKVLKFGGSSISSAENIENVLKVLKSNYDSKMIVVFSAIGKTTDDLIKCGKLASLRDNDFNNVSQSIFTHPIDLCTPLFPFQTQSNLFSYVPNQFTDLVLIL